MPSKKAAFWLLKSEPGTYSFSTLLKDKKTNWDGIRNFQARNFLRQASRGDVALIYHSGDEKAVVGLAEITREAYPDLDADGGDWVQVDIRGLKSLKKSVPLATLKATPALKDILLIKQSRLSVMPLDPGHFEAILQLGQTTWTQE